MLNRIFKLVGLDRNYVRIANVVSCQPPNNWLDGAPWEAEAVSHCHRHLKPVLEEGHKVLVALGGSATRRALDLPKLKHKQADWHGTVQKDPSGKFFVVPTFHPSFLLQGNHKFIGTVADDIFRAISVSKHGWSPSPVSLVVDPDPAWFSAWADEYLQAIREGEDRWLAVDIETPGKAGEDESEVEEDFSTTIIRINFSYHPDEGVTVPWSVAYLDTIQRLLASAGTKCFWNSRFDIPRLRAAGMVVEEPSLDFMWAWHVLQSDLPKGLGFVAPFYSDYGAWKHLSGSDPGRYAAIDAVQTIRVARGVARDLEQAGQWATFINHVWKLDVKVLHPAEKIGIEVDINALNNLGESLKKSEERLFEEIQDLIPDIVRKEKVWKRPPKDLTDVHLVKRIESTKYCSACLVADIQDRHRCRDKHLVPSVVVGPVRVDRWVKLLPFNPASSDQLRTYAISQGHRLGKAKKSKTGKGSTDKKTLERLARSTADPIYGKILEHRRVSKVRGTYVEGTRKRLATDARIHPKISHKPSTGRLSSYDPNIQNIDTDRNDTTHSASGFRACLVPASGHTFVEADYSAIEAVQTGWFSGDSNYIRLAKLGVHGYLQSHLVGRPVNLGWSDEDIGRHLKELKSKFKDVYEMAKRCVHGTNYGLSTYGMVKNYPEIFDLKSAEKAQRTYYDICPKLPEWQNRLRKQAAKQHYLGGKDHPFGYKHWFWAIYAYNSKTRRWSLGKDAKRCVAFYPQSTAAGVIKSAALRLMDPDSRNFIGDVYGGSTPIRALVHDSILLEVPNNKVDYVIERLVSEMTAPIKEQGGLQIGVAVKVGKNWLEMEEVDLKEVGVASDTAVRDAEEDEEEEDAA